MEGKSWIMENFFEKAIRDLGSQEVFLSKIIDILCM